MTDQPQPLNPTPDSPEGHARQRRMGMLRSRISQVERRAANLATRPIGGLRDEPYTVATAERRVTDLKLELKMDVDTKHSLKHEPVPRWQRVLAMAAPGADLLVFIYFLAVVFDVDWSDPRNTPVESAITVVLSLVATIGLAWAMRFIGGRFRDEKADDRRPRFPTGPGRAELLAELVMLVALLAGAAATMVYRIWSDARDAGLAPGPSLLLGLFLATVTLTVNFTIFMVEFSDGSVLTRELKHLWKQLQPIETERAAARDQVAELEQELRALEEQEAQDTRDAA